MRAIILSAGLGERLRPLTLALAKPAIEFLNVPMLAFPYYWLDTLGLDELTFNTHHLPETVRRAVMATVAPETRLHFSHETKILGSGGGIWNSRFFLQGSDSFALANGDGVILCERPSLLEKMQQLHISENALATLLVCPLDGVGSRIPGVWLDSSGRVCGFGKKSPAEGLECLHYASFMLLSDRVWDFLPAEESNIIYDVLEPRIAKGDKIMAYRADDLRWFETGNTADYLKATHECLQHLRERSSLGLCLSTILNRFTPESELKVTNEGCGLIHPTAKIAPSCILAGFYVIGAEVEIQPHARVEDSVLLPGSRVTGGTHVHEQVYI